MDDDEKQAVAAALTALYGHQARSLAIRHAAGARLLDRLTSGAQAGEMDAMALSMQSQFEALTAELESLQGTLQVLQGTFRDLGFPVEDLPDPRLGA
jgi:hypothetical protein